ncbi:CPBP family intramembrane metalloprotease [bacterium]|nr:CPBP family intramembrane metalloprotease [bacterium]
MSALSILIQNPVASLAFLCLLASLISCWFCEGYYLFAPIYVIAYVLAFAGGIVTYGSLLPLSIILICLLVLKFHPKRFVHLFASMILAILGVFIMSHMVKGFHNLLLIDGVQYGTSSIPMNMYLNFDKVSLATFLLGLYVPLINNKDKWKQTFLIVIPYAAFAIIILLFYGRAAHLFALDIKIPSTSLYFLIINLFFISIPEEAFFRGFLQQEIIKGLSNKAGPFLAILSVSILFGIMHFFFIPNFYFVLGATIASLLYGTIYYFSGTIESAIATHFLVNVVHFFFFTYPFFQSS